MDVSKKKELVKKAIEGFSEETLNEMAMESVEGGEEGGFFCTNNCDGGNCAPDCGGY